MSSIKTTVLATLVLALVGCESAPLTVRSISDASTAVPVTPDAKISRPDTAPVITPDAHIVPILVTPDAQPSPDLVPVKTDTQAAGIVVAYSAANPPGYTMYNGTEKVGLLRVNLSGTGNVQSITFKHHGVSASSDWGNFYLFDGDKLLMSASVDPVTNEIVFSRLVLALASTISQLYLTGDLNTSAVAGDTHYFSLESADKVVANVSVGGTFPVVGNTFTASGMLSLTFEPSADSPVSSMIVTANTTDNSVLRMDIDGASESVSVQYATFFATGNNPGADIVSLRIYDNAGTLFCSGALNDNGALICANDAGLFTINGKTTITIKANIDQVFPPGTPYRAVSGDQFKAGIKIQANVSSPREGCFRAIGVRTGLPYTQRDLASGNATSWSLMGPTMTVRKSQPYIATIATSQTLQNGDDTLYKFSVTAPSNEDIGLKRFIVTSVFHKVGSMGNALLLVNGTPLDAVSIGVPGGTWGVDLKTSTITNLEGSLGVVVTADNEITISAGTTKTFELKVTVSGVQAGSMISSNIGADPFDSTTGTIDSHPFNDFLWSDWSADPHSTASADWIGGALVKTLPTVATTLSL
jgi:hypothetical protein